MKKSQVFLSQQDGEKSFLGWQSTERICSYCKNPGHGARRCAKNPHRNVRCPICERMDHGEETCLYKDRSDYKIEVITRRRRRRKRRGRKIRSGFLTFKKETHMKAEN